MIDIGNDNVIYQNKNGIEYIQFKKLLEYGVKHAYTLKGENINFRSNTELERTSYEKIFGALELDINTLVKPFQEHTSNVRCIDAVVPKKNLKSVDGLVTDKENIALVTTNADCILFLFFDPINKVIANVHSGWKGTFQKIAEKTVLKMINNYRCKPENILCFICPSIRACHFEVDEDVKELCEEIFAFTGECDNFIFKSDMKKDKQKYMIDTVYINRIMFYELGLKKENIFDCNICSVCNNHKISSYRADGKEYKLATAIISM